MAGWADTSVKGLERAYRAYRDSCLLTLDKVFLRPDEAHRFRRWLRAQWREAQKYKTEWCLLHETECYEVGRFLGLNHKDYEADPEWTARWQAVGPYAKAA